MLLLQVRFGTLKVLQELYTKLGEEMVVLLPETTPYLYELMEGESCSEPMCPGLVSMQDSLVGQNCMGKVLLWSGLELVAEEATV